MCSMDSSVVEHRTFNPTVASSTLAPKTRPPTPNWPVTPAAMQAVPLGTRRGLANADRSFCLRVKVPRPPTPGRFARPLAKALPPLCRNRLLSNGLEPALPLLRPLAKGPPGDLVLSSGLIVSPRTPHDERPVSSTSNHLQHRKGQPRALAHWKDYRNDDFSRQDPRADPRSDF